jgi:hypothetical protein
MKNLVAVIAATIPTLSAQAADSTAVIAVGACDKGVTGSYARAVRTAMSKLSGSDVATEEATAKPLGGLSTSVQDAERLLTSARVDYSQVFFDKAERSLVAALATLTTAPLSAERWNLEKEVVLLLAQVQVKLNRNTEAEWTLERVLRVEPIEAGHAYPPSFREFVRHAATKVKARPAVTLAITSRPPGLSIAVNGRPFKAPVSLRVAPGEYKIEADFNGRRGMPVIAKVDAVTSVDLPAPDQESVYLDNGPCVAADATRQARLAAMTRIGSVLGVQNLIGVSAEQAPGEEFVVATAMHLGTGAETREGRMKVVGGIGEDDATKLATFLQGGTAKPPVEASGAGGVAKVTVTNEAPASPAGLATSGDTTSVTKSSSSSSGLRVGAYVATGAAVLSLAGSAAFYVGGNNVGGQLQQLQGPGGVFRPGSQAQVLQLQSAQGTDQTLAAVFLTVGAVAAVGAVAMFILSAGNSNSAMTSTSVSAGPGGVTIHF